MIRKVLSLSVLVVVMLVLGATVFAWEAKTGDKGFDARLREMNVSAAADIGAFAVRLSSKFGMDRARIDLLIRSVDHPADAYMVLNVGRITGKPTDTVLAEYQKNKGHGWGVIAKNLGIKPGSREFHELKKISKGKKEGKSGDKGKSKGHGKGKGYDDDDDHGRPERH